jgi:2-polyprenyl-3-methyl-5-hydroxy-6-metoxy-1,4-benzoquinol methylase
VSEKPHSADYFGATRDFWWNHDFLELMSARWRLAAVRSVLDVGCGVGHWGRCLAAAGQV